MKKAQSILEYIIILAAIIAAVLVAAGPDGVVRRAIGSMFSDSSQLIENQTSSFLDQAAGGYIDNDDGGQN